jgi:hypothetical protein
MVLFGRIVFVVGLIITVLSFVLGFWFMFQGNSSVAKPLLMAIPFGFLILFGGLSTVVLFEPRDSEKRE